MGRRLLLALLVLFALSACGGSAAPGAATTGARPAAGTDDFAYASAAASMDSAEAPQEAAAAAPGADAAAGGTTDEARLANENAQAQIDDERLVIRTATLQLLVDDVGLAESQIRTLADSRGGFVLNSQASGEADRRTASISFKVPARRFDEAINELAKLAIKVETQEVQGEDVTDQFVDLESRLRNLRAVEARLLQFLAQAQRTEDALTVNAQLTDIQGQIEAAQGRINYLKQSAALSTISVTLRAEAVVEVLPEPGWTPSATARAALNDLLQFGQGIAEVLIVVAVWSPVWLPLVLLGLWLWRRSRRPAPVAAVPAPTGPSSQP